MTNSLLTGTRVPDPAYAADIAKIVQDAIADLEGHAIPRFADTAERDTAYAAWVAGGGTLEDGMLCHTAANGGTFWHRIAGAWAPWGSTQPYCQVKQDTAQIIPIDEWTTIAMNGESLDSHGWHSTVTNNSRVTADRACIVRVSGSVPWAAPPGSANGRGGARMRKNGALIDHGSAHAALTGGKAGMTAITPSPLVQLGVGDYIELQAYQDYTSVGGGLSTHITPEFRPALTVECIRLL